MEQISYRYHLHLPDGLKIHNIFSPNMLKKYPNNPLPRQELAKPPSKAITRKEE